MKNIISILLIVFTIACSNSSTRHKSHVTESSPSTEQTNGQFELDADLLQYWESFQTDAKAHGFNYDRIYSIRKIILKNPNSRIFYHLQGLTLFDNKTIYINERLLQDTAGLKLVFYHELGHW